MTYASRASLFIALALIAYALPWVDNGNATALSQGAYDLAEWNSISPIVRASSPTMLTSLLLRLPLACLAMVIGFTAPTPPLKSVAWWIAMCAVLITVAASLPPVEFFTGTFERNDPNYQQQFQLTLVALIGGFLGLTGLMPRIRPFVGIVAAIMAAVAGIIGLDCAMDIMDGLALSPEPGMGVVIFIIALALVIGDNVWIGTKKSR